MGLPLYAQEKPAVTADSTKVNAQNDTLARDSAKATIPLASNAIRSKVVYHAKDSMRVDLEEEKIYLYGEADVTYEDINLKANYIEMSFKTNIVSARGTKDSLGKLSGAPIFTQGPQTFNTEEMSFNFQTKKGRISNVITKEGEGYIHGAVVKKDTSDNFFIKKGLYTTCDLEHPHFYINASKLKVIKEDKIVTGPANLWIEDVPTPLAIPFGFFPNKKGRASGLLLPQYGESQNLGFFLKQGGYYWGINDYVDLALTGDIYSKGSYALRANTAYNKRYAFNGGFSLDYAVNRFPNETDFSQVDLQKNFFIKWRHMQDPKARPGSRLSADVNAGTSNFNRYNSTNSLDYLTNTFMSSVNYSKSWKYATLSGGLTHNQNTQTKIVNINAPTLAFAVNRFNPVNIFRKNGGNIGNKWYDKIGLSYTADARNDITAPDSVLFKPGIEERMRNGIRHSIPFTTSFNILKYINFNPRVDYNEVWYLQSYDKRYSASNPEVEIDTVQGFVRAGDIRMAANATTKYYGMYTFRSNKIKAIRHIIVPTVGASYSPERANGVKKVYNSKGLLMDQFTAYDYGIFGPLKTKEEGLLTFDVFNNFEMKYVSKKDTADPVKKLPLIEGLSANASYNFLADSMQWSDIRLSLRTNILQKFDVQLNSVMSPYVLDTTGARRNLTQWDVYGRVGQITNASLLLNFNFNPAARKKRIAGTGTPPDRNLQNIHLLEYVDWTIPWNMNVNYNAVYSPSYSRRWREHLLYYRITHTLGVSGDINLTEKWKIGFRSGYDFRSEKLTYTTLNIYRDLHCWEMRINLVPFGDRKMYSVDINVKASTLRDLKLPMRRDWYDLR